MKVPCPGGRGWKGFKVEKNKGGVCHKQDTLGHLRGRGRGEIHFSAIVW